MVLVDVLDNSETCLEPVFSNGNNQSGGVRPHTNSAYPRLGSKEKHLTRRNLGENRVPLCATLVML